jgi:hypothetical protein
LLVSLVAAKALRLNFTELLPKVMPLREMAAFGANYVSRKLLGRHSVKPYRPDLQRCAKHICIHTGVIHLTWYSRIGLQQLQRLLLHLV